MADDPHAAARPSGTTAPPSPTTAAADAAPLPVGILCPDCGYDLRGSTSERCPECGFLLEPLRAGESQVPWSHRGQLGWFKAYWKTVWLVTRRPKRFCVEATRPVSYPDSQSFRWVTIVHVYVSSLIGALAWILEGSSWRIGGFPWILGGLLFCSLALPVLLPGLASYFFQPRHLTVEQQSRAIALSYYAWAPLAIVSWALPFLVAALMRRPPWRPTISVGLAILAGLIVIMAVAMAYGLVMEFAKRTLHLRPGAMFLRMIVLSALLLGLSSLVVLIPLSVFYFLLIIHSLR